MCVYMYITTATGRQPNCSKHYYYYYYYYYYYKAKGEVPLHAMKAYKGCWGIAPLILNLGVIWRPVVNIMQRLLFPRERTPGTHRIRQWVGATAGMDVSKKISFPRAGIWNPDHPACSQSLHQLSCPSNRIIDTNGGENNCVSFTIELVFW